MAKRRNPAAIVGITLRVRESLRRPLEQSAKKRGVSLNSEVVRRLEASFTTELIEELQRDRAEVLDKDRQTFEEHLKKLWSENEQKLLESQKHLADSNFILEQVKELLREWQAKKNDS